MDIAQNAVSLQNNKTIRLLFLIPSLHGGGAERVLIALANDFYVKGYAVTIVSINNDMPAYPIKKGIDILYLVDRKRNSFIYRIYYAAQVRYRLVKVLKKLRPLCCISFITSANIIGASACQLTGTRYILSERTSPNRTVKKFGYLKSKIAAKLYKQAKAVVVGCRGVEQCLLANKNFETLTNIHTIPNWVTKFDYPIGRVVHGKRFILGIGRLCHVKGFDLLIQAYAHVNINDLDLLIVGEGEEREKLEKLIVSLNLIKKVFLIGQKSNLQDYYSQAEMFVLPSRNEGYPNALVEAMSFGCPCIAVDCEFGPAEIIHHEHNGLLVEQGNEMALTTAIIRLNDNPVLKAKLSVHARDIIRTNDENKLFSVWEQLALS